MACRGTLLRAGRRGWQAAVSGLRSESTTAATPAAAEAARTSPAAALAEMPRVARAVASIKDPLQQQRLREVFELPDDGTFERELFRLNNSSLDYSQGQMILARVVEVDRKRVSLHTGLRPARILRSELTPDSIVGTTVSSSAPRQPGEVRIGDMVKVYLEEPETPEGDSLVSGMQAAVGLRAQAVWKELEQRQRSGQTVRGRVLNQLAGGYSVGIGGLVAFCPTIYCHPATARRVGELQDFKVLLMNKERNNVTVADARVDVQLALLAAKRRRQQMAGRPPPVMGMSQEVMRAGAELREALEQRGGQEGAGHGTPSA